MGNNCYKKDVEVNFILQKQFIHEVPLSNTNLQIELFEENISLNDPRLKVSSIEDFTKITCIGLGGFSKVWKVKLNTTEEVFAMKILNKKKLYIRKSLYSLIREREILIKLNFPLIVNLYYSFSDVYYAYLIMSYAECSDLRRVLLSKKYFSEIELSNFLIIEFIICCLLLSLEYLHSKNIIHRDLKPENLVLDAKGFWNLTDFGISKFWTPNNKNDSSGTIGYMSPETLLKKNYGISSDIFSLGVIAYECLLGSVNFYFRDLMI